jgi:hypothetical protein
MADEIVATDRSREGSPGQFDGVVLLNALSIFRKFFRLRCTLHKALGERNGKSNMSDLPEGSILRDPADNSPGNVEIMPAHNTVTEPTGDPQWLRLKGAEQFWYILHCIAFGAGYLAKVPTKKALQDAGLGEMTSAERFWYVVECVAFGAGYLAKVPAKRALRDAGLAEPTSAEQFWYVLLCIDFGVGYFAKVPMKKALADAGLSNMKDAEQFWYVIQCLYFGAGYFAKVFHKKALSELHDFPVPSIVI